MAFRFPFYGFPFSYNRYNYYNFRKPPVNSYNHNSSDVKEKVSNKEKNEKDEYFFDLFGIHLYFDDILLICLIFFLYNEGVKDDGLFMTLILLLLT